VPVDTVNDITPRIQYVAAGGQTAFDYPFPIFADQDIVVAIADDADSEAEVLTLTTDYTVSGEGNDNGGTVTLVVAATAGQIVTLYRDLPAERLTDIAQNGPWSSANYNDEMDKIIMLIQQLKMQIARAVQLSVTSTTDPDDVNFDDIADLAGALTTLDSLQDVDATSPGDSEVLVFNSSTGFWEARDPALIQTAAADNVIDIRGAMFVGPGSTEIAAASTNNVPILIKQACNISKVTVLTRGGTGSCEIDIWKRGYSNYPPTAAQSITNGNPVEIASGIKTQLTTADLETAGWTRTLSQDDTLMVSLTSSSTFTVIGVFIELTPVDTLPVDDFTDQRIEDIVNDVLDERNIPGLVVDGDEYNITLGSGHFQDLDLYALSGSPAGAVTVNFTVPEGTTVSASSPRTYGIYTDGFDSGSTINLIVDGDVDGCGGEGGDGGALYFGSGISGSGTPIAGARMAASNGQAGGNAIQGPGSGRTLNLTGSGRVRGGGGGGAGGGAAATGAANRVASGGGGGGGAGGGKGGRGGRLGSHSQEAPGANGVDGSRGSRGEEGTGGAANQTGSGATGGAGGDGGDFGAAGSAGTYPTSTWDVDARTGGAAGKAINVNSGTVVTASFTGTISGAVS
jgi:hypothetical protein